MSDAAYEIAMHTLRAFLGTGTARTLITAAVALVVLGLMAAGVPALRRRHEALQAAAGWRAGGAGLLVGAFKLGVLFVLARLLIAALLLQADRFGHAHGRVTEKNRSAVLMKWGYPHEQRELTVEHTERRTWVTRQLKVAGAKEESVVEEGYWQDQERPVSPVRGVMPEVIRVTEDPREVPVAQKPIESADVTVAVRSNPRTLGNANYAGYEDTWTLRYEVANRHTNATTAHLRFPLPADKGVFNNLSLRVDGQDLLGRAETRDEGEGTALVWDLPMNAGQTHVVELGYESRGLEYLRYIPRRMAQTGHYRVEIRVEGVAADQLDFPIGSMPPRERLADMRGTAYALHWNLDNALTCYDIGIKFPSPEQPAYHFATLLREAPGGLLLLLLLLVLPRLVWGARVPLAIAGFLALAYYLLHTFMAALADLLPGFWLPFAVAAGGVGVLLTLFRLADRASRFLALQDAAAFLVLAWLYPLAVIDADRTAFWKELLYLVLGIYLGVLFAVRSARRRRETGEASAAPRAAGEGEG